MDHMSTIDVYPPTLDSTSGAEGHGGSVFRKGLPWYTAHNGVLCLSMLSQRHGLTPDTMMLHSYVDTSKNATGRTVSGRQKHESERPCIPMKAWVPRTVVWREVISEICQQTTAISYERNYEPYELQADIAHFVHARAMTTVAPHRFSEGLLNSAATYLG